MTLSSGSSVQISYKEETTRNTNPGGIAKILRTTGRNINLVKDLLESDEVRSTRQISDLRHGMNRVEGTFGYELSRLAYDDLLEGVFANTWRSPIDSGTITANLEDNGNGTADLTEPTTGTWITDGWQAGDRVTLSGFANAGNNITYEIQSVESETVMILKTPGGAVTDETGVATARAFGHSTGSIDMEVAAGASTATITAANGDVDFTVLFRPGDWVTTTGFTQAANNGTFRINSITSATVLVLDTPTVMVNEDDVDETEVMSLAGGTLWMGQELKTYTFERAFTDITQYQLFTGCALNSMSVTVSPDSMVSGDFGIIGMQSGAMSGSSGFTSATAAPTEAPFAPFDGGIQIGGTTVAVVTSVDFNIENNRTLEGVIGSKYSPDVFEGRGRVSGTVTFFLEDATYFNYFVNETAASMWIKMDDVDGSNWMQFNFPNCKFNTGNIDPPQEGPVPITVDFVALEDDTYATTCFVQRSANS